ncbi:MAG: 6-carboxytetrahydropterin synthase [candidate division WOR-3 bacterium]
MGKFKVRVRHTFCGAHYLKSYKGKAEPLHGHNYRVEVVIGGDLNGEEYVVDFLEVKDFLMKILPHRININDLIPGNSTSERLAEWVFKRVKEKFPNVEEVIVWETDEFGASYSE